MVFQYRINYNNLSDKQLVDKILADPHNEEAAVYMLSPLLHSVYNMALQKLGVKTIRGNDWFEDCVDELFIHLRSKEGNWHTLSTFEWRSTFGGRLKGVAENKFKEVLPKLINPRTL